MTTTDDLRALLAKATPGPWEWRREKLISVGDSTTVINYADYEGMWFASYEGRDDANKEILAAAVNALPGLLDELDALRAIVMAADAMREWCDPISEQHRIVRDQYDAARAAAKGDQSTNTLDDEQSLDYFNKYIAGDR